MSSSEHFGWSYLCLYCAPKQISGIMNRYHEQFQESWTGVSTIVDSLQMFWANDIVWHIFNDLVLWVNEMEPVTLYRLTRLNGPFISCCFFYFLIIFFINFFYQEVAVFQDKNKFDPLSSYF